MPGAGSGQSLRGRLPHGCVERGPDRASGDHHGPANSSAGPALVKLWLARLWEHPGACLPQASADRQTGASSLGRPRDAHLDTNRQAS